MTKEGHEHTVEESDDFPKSQTKKCKLHMIKTTFINFDLGMPFCTSYFVFSSTGKGKSQQAHYKLLVCFLVLCLKANGTFKIHLYFCS